MRALGKHEALDEDGLDLGAHHVVHRPHHVAHALEATARVGQPLEGACRRLGLARGALREQEGHRRRGLRQPTTLNGPQARADEVDRLPVPHAIRAVQVSHHRHFAFERLVRRFVAADFGVRLVADADSMGFEVESLKYPPLQLEAHRGGSLRDGPQRCVRVEGRPVRRLRSLRRRLQSLQHRLQLRRYVIREFQCHLGHPPELPRTSSPAPVGRSRQVMRRIRSTPLSPRVRADTRISSGT